MTRFTAIALSAVFTGLIAAPAVAQGVAFPAEPDPRPVYRAMNLNPPGVSGPVYNDGTTEQPVELR